MGVAVVLPRVYANQNVCGYEQNEDFNKDTYQMKYIYIYIVVTEQYIDEYALGKVNCIRLGKTSMMCRQKSIPHNNCRCYLFWSDVNFDLARTTDKDL